MDRNGLANPKYRWPNGTLPFIIEGDYTEEEIQTINRAMELYHKYTCLTFREKLPSDEDYIAIINDATGCWSTIGRQEGMQEVNLEAPLCVQLVGTVTHELMHAAGFLHELTRPDRDDFVEINWSNVREAYKHNFKKQRVGEVDYYGVTYDYNSVMHYSKFAFTKDRSIPSVIAKVFPISQNMGQRQGFSIKDIAEVNAMYNCSEKTKVALNEYNEKKPGVPVEDYIFSE
nr:unnamed protein product [Callosobruchus chinensis]